jgi:lipopolysaccharide transport system ATP-binding protein
MSLAIKVENLSKAYQLGTFGTGTLSQDIERKWAKIRGKEDPFLKIGEENDRTKKGKSNIVWSLKDINLDIENGDAIGIIGRNGAGKSTLLKVLSQITSPTTGKIKLKGRIASLLEVGTGFHPELSGRENIFLNGAILGMNRREIGMRFDEIVDFSGVEKYLDTPVKRYSSGMYVRLAFAVAAHLQSEILIVDEVLAVGDLEFQKKCLGKMGDISVNSGKTVIFVSHNLSSIKNFCNKTIYLKNGYLNDIGLTRQVIDNYLGSNIVLGERSISLLEYKDSQIAFQSIEVMSNKESINISDEIKILIKYHVVQKVDGIGFTLLIQDNENNEIFSSINNQDPFYKINMDIGEYQTIVLIPPDLLNDITYNVTVNVFNKKFQLIQSLQNIYLIKPEDNNKYRNDFHGEYGGLIRPYLKWNTIKLD